MSRNGEPSSPIALPRSSWTDTLKRTATEFKDDVVLLLWLRITNMAIRLGTEFNAETERAKPLTAGVPDAERTIGLPERKSASEQKLPRTA
jgi:hypothetical protein